MNTVVTSREAILEECRKIVMEQGISAVNMRSVAAACGVAVGSIYNYFPSKTDLISAAAVSYTHLDVYKRQVLGFNFVGDGLRDAFDPKMKR